MTQNSLWAGTMWFKEDEKDDPIVESRLQPRGLNIVIIMRILYRHTRVERDA